MGIFVPEPLALFGGSFDPVHQAHLEAALAASRALDNACVTFLPNARSPLKDQPGASSKQRLAMLKLALAPYAQLRLNDFEIKRPAPSYTHASLKHFRQLQGDAALILVMGADSLASLQHWGNWRDFARLCHLLVLPRPGAAAAPHEVVELFPEATAKQLLTTPAGLRLMLGEPLIDLSSSRLRNQPTRGVESNLLPPEVAAYIAHQQLYR